MNCPALLTMHFVSIMWSSQVPGPTWFCCVILYHVAGMRTVFVILSILAVAFAVFEDDTPLLKEGLEQQGADPSLDELQHDVQALQDQVAKGTFVLCWHYDPMCDPSFGLMLVSRFSSSCCAQVNELKQNLADGDEAATEVTDSSEVIEYLSCSQPLHTWTLSTRLDS